MAKSFNDIRIEADVIAACFEFSRLMSKISISSMQDVLNVLQNAIINERSDNIVRLEYVEYIKTAIKSAKAFNDFIEK